MVFVSFVVPFFVSMVERLMVPRRWIQGCGATVVVGALVLSALLNASPGTSPIADAAMRGDKDAVRALLKQAVEVSAAQGDGMTALHWAAITNDTELTDLLLVAGANVKATTRVGSYTPLVLAAREGNAAVMDPLLKAGADANAKTTNGTSALMLAAQSGSTEAVTLLLDAGADLTAKEPVRGLTPIMFAAASDRAPIVALLAQRGADVKATSAVVGICGRALRQSCAAAQGR